MKPLHRNVWRPTLLGAVCLAAQSWIPASAQVQYQYKIGDESGIAGLDLEDIDLFGFSVASIGDLDDDGVPDIAVGAPRGDDGDTDVGGVWIFFLNVDHTVKGLAAISATAGGFTGTLEKSDYFGTSVCGLGDLDGDGVEDIAVGAGGDDDTLGRDRGAVWILFLDRDGSVIGYQKISDSEGNFTGVLTDTDFFGQSIANLGDLNGDGVTDIAVGAPGSDVMGFEDGAVWILFLETDGNVQSYAKIDNSTSGFAGSLDDGDSFGHSITAMDDKDGNGSVDIAVGTIRDDDGGPDRGAVWSIFLNPSGAVVSSQKISALTGGMQGFLDDFDIFGSSISNIGDLDGDGISDLAVGATGDDDGGLNAGGVYLMYMWSNGRVKEAIKVPLDLLPFVGAVDPLDYFGFSVSNASDINGDGVIDLVVGAIGDDGQPGGIERGAVYVLQLGFRGHWSPARVTTPGRLGIFADVAVRNGTGVNRVCLTNLTLPRMGTNWETEIDGSLHTSQTPTFLVGYDTPLTLMTPFGELLLATEAFGGVQLFFQSVMTVSWVGSYSLPVPNDIALEGFTLSTQGAIYGTFIELCNALDLTIGF